jgi:hypothetical protein
MKQSEAYDIMKTFSLNRSRGGASVAVYVVVASPPRQRTVFNADKPLIVISLAPELWLPLRLAG